MDLSIVTDFITNRLSFTQTDLYIGYFVVGVIWALATNDWSDESGEDADSSNAVAAGLWTILVWPLFFLYHALRVFLSPLRDTFYRWKLEHEYLDYKNGKISARNFYTNTHYGQLLEHIQQTAMKKERIRLQTAVEKLEEIFEHQIENGNPSAASVMDARNKIRYARGKVREAGEYSDDYEKREMFADHFNLKDVVRYNAFRRKTVDVYTQGSDEHEVMSWIELVNFTNG